MAADKPVPREVLAHSLAYGRMDEVALERLATIARTVELTRGLSLFKAGDECPAIFVMHSGVVRLSQTAPNGKVHVLRFAEERQSFAEAAVIGRFRCPVDADVIDPGIAVKIGAKAFLDLLEGDHGLCLSLLNVMAQRNRVAVRRAGDIALRDAAGRLAHFLLDRAGDGAEEGEAVRLMVSKRELAQHLNLTSETLSRVLRRLTDSGVIETDLHHEVRIVDRGELRTLAGDKPR